MNRAARRAQARRRVVRVDPSSGRRASGHEVQVARAAYARMLRGEVLVEAAEELQSKSWVDRFRRRVLGR